MKPTFQYIEKPGRRDSLDQVPRHAPAFPQTDYNFQAASHCGGRSLGSPRRSFHQISQGYFKQEARLNFAAEAALFSLIVVTAAVPLFYSAIALLQLVRSVSAL